MDLPPCNTGLTPLAAAWILPGLRFLLQALTLPRFSILPPPRNTRAPAAQQPCRALPSPRLVVYYVVAVATLCPSLCGRAGSSPFEQTCWMTYGVRFCCSSGAWPRQLIVTIRAFPLHSSPLPVPAGCFATLPCTWMYSAPTRCFRPVPDRPVGPLNTPTHGLLGSPTFWFAFPARTDLPGFPRACCWDFLITSPCLPVAWEPALPITHTHDRQDCLTLVALQSQTCLVFCSFFPTITVYLLYTQFLVLPTVPAVSHLAQTCCLTGCSIWFHTHLCGT